MDKRKVGRKMTILNWTLERTYLILQRIPLRQRLTSNEVAYFLRGLGRYIGPQQAVHICKILKFKKEYTGKDGCIFWTRLH